MARSKDALDRPTEPDAVVAFWLTEIKDARKREKDFRKDGEKILKIYDGTNQNIIPFNILFSNTETLLPAIYSAVPRPVVSRRFKDNDLIGKHASAAGTRMLEFLLDTNLNDYDAFDTVMRHTVLDALLPGRGLSSVKYHAMVHEPDESEGEDQGVEVSHEMVCLETHGWSRVYLGYAKKWSKVPWIAFEEYVDKKEATRLFGKAIADKITYTKDEPYDGEDKRSNRKENAPQGATKTACIYQIWDRQGGNRVKYLSPQYPDGLLKDEEDPLELSGFFPCPKPLQFLEKTHSLVPTALYKIYENQATELNNIQLRLNELVRACKARGIYDTGLGPEIQKLMEADDNELIPAESASSLAADKGLGNAVWFWPLEVIQATLQSLYTARESCKQVIYEITGISDILRGASTASETATAQNIKNQWGTLRLKRLQKAVAVYARDVLRLMLELAASKIGEETWAKMTGLPYLTQAQVQQLSSLLQAAQMQLQQVQMMMPPPMPPQPGMPPQAPAPMPPQVQQLQQQVQQYQQQLQTPHWAQVLETLQDDMSRAYKIDIETNSTVETDATEDQANITKMMTAMGQYLNGVSPLVANGSMPFEVAKNMLLVIARRFQFGDEIENDLKQMTQPKPPDDGSAKAQAQAQQVEQMKMQLEQQRMQLQDQQFKIKLQADQAVQQAEVQQSLQSEARAHELALAQIQSKKELMALEVEAKRQAQLAELNSQRTTAHMLAKMTQETDLKKASLQAATQLELASLTQTAAAVEADPTEIAESTKLIAQILERQEAMMQMMIVPKINIEG